MAVKQARDNEEFAKKVKVGSSGGPSPEGWEMSAYTGGSHSVGEEGVATRGAKGDAKRFEEAEKFQQSKIAVDKMTAKDWEKVKEKNDKKVEDQPTAAGADVSKLETGAGQPAKVTEKEEKADAEAAKKQTTK